MEDEREVETMTLGSLVGLFTFLSNHKRVVKCVVKKKIMFMPLKQAEFNYI